MERSHSEDLPLNTLPIQRTPTRNRPHHSRQHQSQSSQGYLSPPPHIRTRRPSSSAGSSPPRSPYSDELDGSFHGSFDGHTAVSSDTEDILKDINISEDEAPGSNLANDVSCRPQDHSPQNEAWNVGDAFRYPIEIQPDRLERKSSWEVVYERARKDDLAQCAIWKEEIDKLLVFASLFAATVVAFIIVSYQLLLPTPDAVMKGLHDMAVSFAAEYFSNGTCTLKADVPLSSSPNSFQPSASVLRMNTSWFMSMTLAISTVLIGTICLQWIREYQRDTRLGPKQAFAVRQMRHDGFEAWNVPLICSLLSLSLQASLLLFFWGLLEFLWTLNTAVTLIISVIIAIVIFFMIFTIVAPAIQCIIIDSENLHKYQQCAFKSPQARIFSVAAFTVAIFAIRVIQSWSGNSKFMENKEMFLKKLLDAKGWDWVSFDDHWHQHRISKAPDAPVMDSHYIPRALGWIGRNFVHDREAIFALYRLLRTANPSQASQILQIIAEDPAFMSDYEPLEMTEVLSDLQAAHLLREMVQRNPELQDSVLSHRAELFIRIMNYMISERVEAQGHEEGRLVEKFMHINQPRSLNPFIKNQNYSTVEHALAIQIIMTFRKYLKNDYFPNELWEIIKPMVFHFASEIKHGTSPLAHEIVLLNVELKEYFRRMPPHERWRLNNYIDQFQSHPNTSWVELLDSLNSLKQVLGVS